MNMAIAILISIVLIIISIKVLLNIKHLLRNGITVSGVIFDFSHGNNQDSFSIFPVVRFLTEENQWVTKSTRLNLTPNLYKKGQEVTVIYQKNDPEHFLIRDKFLYIIPIFMFAVALLILFFTFIKLI
jgi:hypothetical protein